jgi:membrane protein implicated in regulation of membrane protease activity
METWWEGLSTLNKCLAGGALFFSLLFLWQLISMILGMDLDSQAEIGDISTDAHVDFGGDADVDVGDVGDHPGDAGHDTHALGGEITFTLVSFRSMIAFGTLFCWAGALYVASGMNVFLALLYSFFWGLAGLFSVSYLLFKLLQFQEAGNVSLWSTLGEEAVVYLNIPSDGIGEVRVLASGGVSYVKAASKTSEPLEAGARVRVVGISENNTLEVEPIDRPKGE